MITAREAQRTSIQTRPSATLSATNLAWNGPGRKQCNCVEWLAKNRLNHVVYFLKTETGLKYI